MATSENSITREQALYEANRYDRLGKIAACSGIAAITAATVVLGADLSEPARDFFRPETLRDRIEFASLAFSAAASLSGLACTLMRHKYECIVRSFNRGAGALLEPLQPVRTVIGQDSGHSPRLS